VPSDQIVQQVFGDWKAGPWHSLGPDKGAALGKRYDSINMQVYDNGTLGPRPCLFDVTGGTFTETLSAFLGAAFFHVDFYYALDDYSDAWVYVFDGSTTVRRINLAATQANDTVTISSAASIDTQVLPPRYDSTHQAKISRMPYFELNTTDGTYGGEAAITQFSHASAPGVQAVTQPASWSPHTIIKHRDRFWSWGDASNANRVHYSIPGDMTSAGAWTDADLSGSFDIGPIVTMPIVGVWQLYDSLIFAMKDLRWYVFRYTDDPQFGEVRYIGKSRIPDFSIQVAEAGDALYFLTENGGVSVVTSEKIDDEALDYISVPSGGPIDVDHYFYRGIVAPEHNAISLPFGVNSIPASSPSTLHKGDFSFDLVNGVWVKSLYWGVDSTDLAPSIVDTFEAGTSHFGFLAVPDDVSGSSWKAYVRPVTLNRPSHSTDNFASQTEVAAHSDDATDRFTGEIELTRWKAPESGTGVLEAIIIDFDYWNVAGFETPAFVVTIDYEHALGETLAASVGSLAAGDLEATLQYTSKRARVVLNPAALPAMSSAKINVTGIKSVAFVSIVAEFRVQSQEPLTSQGEA
jgi:hypothetical protein